MSKRKRQWSEAIGKIKIEGANETQRKIFATALYHAMIDPRKISDSDGRYMAAGGKVEREQGFAHRTIFSGWDVFRAELPLMSIIDPTLVNDQICSLLELAEKSGKGYLERWEIMNAYSGCMDGDPAIAVILDAYTKGIRKFDIHKAYAACRQTAAGSGTQTNRPDNDFYMAKAMFRTRFRGRGIMPTLTGVPVGWRKRLVSGTTRPCSRHGRSTIRGSTIRK